MLDVKEWGEDPTFSPLSAFILDHPYSVSIHLIASESFTLLKYLWGVDKSACRNITLPRISIGVPDLEAYVAVCRLFINNLPLNKLHHKSIRKQCATRASRFCS